MMLYYCLTGEITPPDDSVLPDIKLPDLHYSSVQDIGNSWKIIFLCR